MSNTIVSNVYRFVIDDVINQVRGDFEDMGIDESVLQELQRSWESKVARSRVANFGFKEEGYYEEENNTVNNEPQLQYPTEYNNGAPSAASLANLAVNAINSNNSNRPSLPPQQQQQQQQQVYGLNNRVIPDPNTLINQYQMMQQQQLPKPNTNNSNNNLAELQLPSINRPNLPQNDGANDMTTEDIDRHIEDMIQSSQQEEDSIEFTASSFSGEPIALDSLPDHVKELMKEARQRAIDAGAISKRRIPQLDGEDSSAQQNNDEDINSDLDDTDEDDDDGEGGEEIEHIILCLYDKVTRTKNKWKCVLKDGIMLVNGKDYLFQRANGDFEW